MTAVANGIALHGALFASTFLMFVEYARNAARMAALMKARQIMVYTHDSIGLGEDGPTRGGTAGQSAADAQLQHLAPLRPVETAVARQAAIATGRADGADPVATKPGADAAYPGTGAGYRPGWLRA